MTTRRENLLKVFRHEEPDWVPVIVVADDYNHPFHMPRNFYRNVRGIEITAALSRYFDIDILDRTSCWREWYRNVEHTVVAEGSIITERWETPYGTIMAKRQRIDYPSAIDEAGLLTWFPVEYPIKSCQDYRAFAWIIENLEYEFDLPALDARVRDIGDQGLVTVGAPSSPLGMLVRCYMGVERLAYAYADHPVELRDLVEAMADKFYECYRAIARSAADAVINYDDTSTLAISPKMFRELELDFLNKTADIMHESGKFLIHHACGHVFSLLSDFRSTRIDAFDGPSPPPQGDTTVRQAREGLGPDIVIMPFTQEDAIKSGDPIVIRGMIRKMFEDAGGRRNFIVDIVPPPGIPVENLWVAVDEAKRLSQSYFAAGC